MHRKEKDKTIIIIITIEGAVIHSGMNVETTVEYFTIICNELDKFIYRPCQNEHI